MSELTQRQEMAIEGLLSSTSIEEAARTSGLSSKTIRRYLAQPEFDAVLREHLHERVRIAAAGLRAGSASAAACLIEIVENREETASARTRAAIALLDLTRRWIEIEDLGPRLDALEAALLRKDRS